MTKKLEEISKLPEINDNLLDVLREQRWDIVRHNMAKAYDAYVMSCPVISLGEILNKQYDLIKKPVSVDDVQPDFIIGNDK